MRLLFIRHGDPDYEHDTLTEKGRREAELLAGVIDRFGIDEAFVSPLGRARDTAAYSLKKLGMKAVTMDWLREFPADFDANKADDDTRQAYITELNKTAESDTYQKRIVWDILPSYFGSHPELFERDGWRESDIVKSSDMIPKYEYVKDSFLKLLADHGYVKEGDIFRAKENNDKTLAFFCHFGVTSVLLSILFNISPFVTLQYLAMAPTSMTELVTEERQKGIAIFRTLKIGDISHLTNAGEEPSFSARFCEKFENEDERH